MLDERFPNSRSGLTLWAKTAALLAMAFVLAFGAVSATPESAFAQTNQREVEPESPLAGNVPGGHLGNNSDAEIWRAVRRGEGGLVQSDGDNWRAMRNGPMTVFGAWAVLGIVGVLALFFALRGRIRIDAGQSGRYVERFNLIERIAHWVTAITFIVLAITGLNLLYGRHVLLPAFGPEIFAAITNAGKFLHNWLAWPFMAGLVLIFVLWVRHNIPNKKDLQWVAVGGGLFSKGVHPPAKKFNAGQKLIFWLVILGGISMSLSGWSLLFPFQYPMFAETFKVFNLIGLNLPTELTPMQEMQLAQLWHTFVSLVMIAVILAHIYIGSMGMEGAFAAMGSGQVDENWAHEHHSLWLEELKQKERTAPEPAE